MTTTSPTVAPRLRPADLAGVASVGLRTRRLRAALSALGIAIGVAAIVAVLGLAQSSQAGLLAEIGKLGTNLLTVTNGQNLTGGTAELPTAAPGMIADLPGVTAVQDTGAVSNVSAYRSPKIPSIDTNALTVAASSLGLPGVVGTPCGPRTPRPRPPASTICWRRPTPSTPTRSTSPSPRPR
jgi:putative ABC transport system permease protein